jgi:hypothetical protein
MMPCQLDYTAKLKVVLNQMRDVSSFHCCCCDLLLRFVQALHLTLAVAGSAAAAGLAAAETAAAAAGSAAAETAAAAGSAAAEDLAPAAAATAAG